MDFGSIGEDEKIVLFFSLMFSFRFFLVWRGRERWRGIGIWMGIEREVFCFEM